MKYNKQHSVRQKHSANVTKWSCLFILFILLAFSYDKFVIEWLLNKGVKLDVSQKTSGEGKKSPINNSQ